MDSNERKLAHSDRLVLPRITAPPARSFAATVESCKADMPTSAHNPAVVCILSTVASTGSRRQQPCCGDHGHQLLCTREAYNRPHTRFHSPRRSYPSGTEGSPTLADELASLTRRYSDGL